VRHDAGEASVLVAVDAAGGEGRRAGGEAEAAAAAAAARLVWLPGTAVRRLPQSPGALARLSDDLR
jgi:hypothetical protein